MYELLYTLFCKIVLDTFCLAGLFDQIFEKSIAMINSKLRKPVLPVFRTNCFVINYSCWSNKSFFLSLVLQEFVRVLIAPHTGINPLSPTVYPHLLVLFRVRM